MSRIQDKLAALKLALKDVAPARVVTGNWADFALQPAADLRVGIWIVRLARIGPMTYETSDNNEVTDSLRATQVAPLHITLLCQQELPAGATGEDVDAAELAMVDDLDALAARVMEIDGLESLQLVDVQLSQQVECPFAWVHSTWKDTAL